MEKLELIAEVNDIIGKKIYSILKSPKQEYSYEEVFVMLQQIREDINNK